jgi:hypothetical protein
MSVDVGNIYERTADDGDGPRLIKIVGQRNGTWIAADAEQFGPPFAITGAQLQAQYGAGQGEPPVQIDEAAAWQKVSPGYAAESLAAERERWDTAVPPESNWGTAPGAGDEPAGLANTEKPSPEQQFAEKRR